MNVEANLIKLAGPLLHSAYLSKKNYWDVVLFIHHCICHECI